MYLARTEHFEVGSDGALFTCQDRGAKCGFSSNEYDFVHFGTGQKTQDVQGAIWGSNEEDSVLNLGKCKTELCIVTCNANCACSNRNDDSQACPRAASRSPTASPKTAAPVPSTCSNRDATSEVHCPDLMNNGLDEGNEKNFDCFSFCEGQFSSACFLGGECRLRECNTTSTGRNGLVAGCTPADKLKLPKDSGAPASFLTLVYALVTAASLWSLACL